MDSMLPPKANIASQLDKTRLSRIEALPYGVAVSSSSGRILYANRASLKLLTDKASVAALQSDLHATNFTPAWTAVRNALPGLKVIRDNHLTLCYVDKFKQLNELTVCHAGIDAGPDRHILLLSRREADVHASSAHRHRAILADFAAAFCKLNENSLGEIKTSSQPAHMDPIKLR